MIVQLTKNCILGRKGFLLNLPMGRATDLIRAGIADEYEFKVVEPEIKEQPKKRGRPRKNDALHLEADGEL